MDRLGAVCLALAACHNAPGFDTNTTGAPGVPAAAVYDGRLWVQPPEGNPVADVLLDTGSVVSLIAPEQFPGAGWAASPFDATFGKVAQLTVGGITFHDFSAGTTTTNNGLANVLGAAEFGPFSTRFDHRGQQIVFDPPTAPDDAALVAEMPIHLEGDTIGGFPQTRIVVDASVEGGLTSS